MEKVTLESLAQQINERFDKVEEQLKVLNWTTETTAGTNIGMAIAMQEMQKEMTETLPAFTPEHDADLYNNDTKGKLKGYKEEHRRRCVEDLRLDEYPFPNPTP